MSHQGGSYGPDVYSFIMPVIVH